MPNPLDPLWQAYVSARDALRAVSRSDTANAAVFGTSTFMGMVGTSLDDRLAAAQTELDDLTILSFTATFEATVWDHLATELVGIRATYPGLLGTALNETLENQMKRMPFTQIIGFFGLRSDMVSDVKRIWQYRNWVAHGRQRGRPATADPGTAYSKLTDFLREAGLV
jgi:hypothetical protein